MAKNRYTRALKVLKNSQVDEKLQLLEALPTNNTTSMYALTPEINDTETITLLPRTADFTQDGDGGAGYTGDDTTGLFLTDGTILTIEPPGDTSYILGPMASMWYAWGNFTQIGYIRQSDRKMVNLARITGELGNWDGESNFTSYGQLTLDQAVWFQGTPKLNGADNDTPNYRAFYPGPPSNTPDQYGRYECVITGTPKPATEERGSRTPPTMGNPEEAGFPWIPDILRDLPDKFKDFVEELLEDGLDFLDEFLDSFTPEEAEALADDKVGEDLAADPTLTNKELNELANAYQKAKEKFNLGTNFLGGPLPDLPPKSSDKAGPAFGDDKTANRERDKNIRELEKNLGQYGDSNQRVEDAVKDWNNAVHKAGGGKAAETEKNQSRAEVVQQGRENLGLDRTQYFPKDFNNDKEYHAYKLGGGDAALADGKSKNAVISQGYTNVRRDGHWMNPNTWKKDPFKAINSLVDDAMIVSGVSQPMKAVQTLQALRATQAIYGAKNTAQALNNINKAKFTAAKGKGAPRPPKFSDKGREVWNTKLGKYETITPKNKTRWEWSQRTLNDDLFKHYQKTGEMPVGLDGWNVRKAFTPELLKTGPTPGAAAALKGIGSLGAATGLNLGTAQPAGGQVTGSSSDDSPTAKEKAAAKSVEKPDGSTDFDKLGDLFYSDPDAFENAVQGLMKGEDEREQTQFSEIESKTPKLDAKTSSQIDNLLQRGANAKPGSTTSANISKELLKLYDKLPPDDPRSEQILNQISTPMRGSVGGTKLKKPGQVRFDTKRGDFTKESVLFYEQPTSAGSITAHTPQGDVTVNVPSANSTDPQPYQDPGDPPKPQPFRSEQPTNYSRNRLSFLKSYDSPYFVAGYVGGMELEDIQKMVQGTNLSYVSTVRLINNKRNAKLEMNEAKEAFHRQSDITFPAVSRLSEELSRVIASDDIDEQRLDEILNEIDRAWAPWYAADQRMIEAGHNHSATVKVLGDYVKSGKINDPDPYGFGNPNIPAERPDNIKDAQIKATLEDLKKAKTDAEKSALLNKLKAMGLAALLAGIAVLGVAILAKPAIVASIGLATARLILKAFNASKNLLKSKPPVKPPSPKYPTTSKIKVDPLGSPRKPGISRGRGMGDRWEGPLSNSHEPKGQVLAESRKRIFRDLKKPFVIPEQPTKFKVKPTGRNNKVVGAGLMKPVEDPISFKPDLNIWKKGDKKYNESSSQEKKNQVLELVGAAEHHWTTLTERSDRERQEKVNEAMAQEFDREMEMLYEKYKKKETKVDKVIQSIRTTSLDKSKIKPVYPDQPPPETVDGYHPKYGKKYKHDKLDPHSAEFMPKTGNPEIDVNIDKATDHEKKDRKVRILRKPSQLKEEISVKAKKKSNWREEINLQESDWSPIAGSGPTNSASQSFEYPGGTTVTVSGLGGIEGTPSTVTVDQFGDVFDVDAPNYSQLALQGYAPLLQIQKRGNQTEDERIDAEIRKLEEQLVQLDQKAAELDNERYETEPELTGMTPEEYTDRTNEINAKWADKMWPLQKKLNDNPVCIAADKCTGTKAALMRMSEAATKELENLYDEYMSQTKADQKAQDDHIKSYAKKFDSIRKEKEALRAKIAELEKQRPINQQLDASQQVYPNLPFMGARVQPVAGQPSFNYDPSKTSFGADYGEIAQVMDGEKLLPQELQDILNRRRGKSPALGGTVTTAEKKKIADFMITKDAHDLLINDPDTYDRLERALTGRIPPRNLYPGKTPQPQDSYGDFLRGGGMIDPLAGANAFASGIRSVGDALADKLDVGTAKDVFDYFTDWNKNRTKDSRPQDLTNLLSPNDKAALQDLVDRSMDGRTDEFGAMGVNNELQHIINSNPGLRNSIGTLDPDAGDGAYVQGDNIVINKAYDFSNVFDILGSGNLAVGFGALGYGIGSGTFSIPELISGTDTMNMQIKIPIRRKKKKRKVKESTWSKLKKHR